MKCKLLKPFNLFLLVSVIITLVIASCKHDTILIEKGTLKDSTVYFSDQILPIFQTNCATTNCHDGSRLFELNSYETIMDQVQAGNAYGSKAYTVLTNVNVGLMPPNKPLSLKQRTLIKLWIDQGALNNKMDTTIISINKKTHSFVIANEVKQSQRTTYQ